MHPAGLGREQETRPSTPHAHWLPHTAPQSDLHREGVLNLGALLDRSEQMISLVDERYFKRLWCMFELAAFYRRAGPDRIILIPMHVPLLLAASVVGLYGPNLIDFLLFMWWPAFANDTVLFNLLSIVMNTPWMMAMLWAVVEAHKTEEAIHQLRSFSLADAACYSEADRENLLDLIGEWFTDRVGADGADETRLRQIGWQIAPSLAVAREKEHFSVATVWW